jgi:hypothetical protein
MRRWAKRTRVEEVAMAMVEEEPRERDMARYNTGVKVALLAEKTSWDTATEEAQQGRKAEKEWEQDLRALVG